MKSGIIEYKPLSAPSGLSFFLDFNSPNHYISKKDFANYIAVSINKKYFKI